jgi:hypothetical protein
MQPLGLAAELLLADVLFDLVESGDLAQGFGGYLWLRVLGFE